MCHRLPRMTRSQEGPRPGEECSRINRADSAREKGRRDKKNVAAHPEKKGAV